MTLSAVPPMPAGDRAPGPSLGASLVVVGIGVAMVIVALVAIVVPLVGTFTSPAYAVPPGMELHLKHAHYTIYRYSGTRSAFGTETDDPNAPGIYPDQVSVVGPDGSPVPVSFDTHIESLTRGSTRYTGAVTFYPPAAGLYALHFTNPVPTKVIVARSLSDALRSVLVWFGVAALGGAALIAGVVMWIVGATRRGRAKRAMYAWGGGWGPSPYGAPPPYGPPPQQWGAPPPYGPPPQPWGPPPGPPPTGPPPAPPPQEPPSDPPAPGV